MSVGSKLYMGKVFRGSKVVEYLRLPGVHMGKLSNGRHFIIADGDMERVTVR